MEVVPIPVDDEGLRVERARADGRHVGRCHARPSVPLRCGAGARATCRTRSSGPRRRAADRRGRLRRRVSLRPWGGRRAAGSRARTGALHRLGLEAPGSRHAPRLAAAASVAGLAADRGEGGRGRAARRSSGQLALCDFIARGELDRHMRRMRRRYQRGARALLAGARPLAAGERAGRRRRRAVSSGRAAGRR